MSRVALSGANGFLGWHTRLALAESGTFADGVPLGSAFEFDQAVRALDGAEQAIHLAGVNRGTETDVAEGNLLFAQQFATALRAATMPPPVVVFANSTQVGNGSVYGQAKQGAAELLERTAHELGLEFRNVMLPNLFGEHGTPFYNAVTSTFCDQVLRGETPEIQVDKELTLLHAQNAADLLVGAVDVSRQSELEVRRTVSALLAELQAIAAVYATGEVPDVSTTFARDLFNTYRSYAFAARPTIELRQNADARGVFVETIRARGGAGQSSVSTTVSGVTRGEHFHRRKIERFVVVSGTATISLRRLFHDDVVRFEVNGAHPVAIDMPTGWAHNITNTGEQELLTAFWSNELFDPAHPDTIAEAV